MQIGCSNFKIEHYKIYVYNDLQKWMVKEGYLYGYKL